MIAGIVSNNRRPVEDRAFQQTLALNGAVASACVFLAVVGYYFVFSYTVYLVGLAAILVVVGNASVGRPASWRSLAPLLIFQIYQTASSFWSPDPSAGLTQSAVDFLFLMFAIVASLPGDRMPRDWALGVMKWFAIGMLVCALAAQLTLGEFSDPSKGAFRTLIGVAFLSAIPALVYFTVRKRSLATAVALLSVVVVGVQIGSRVFALFFLPLIALSLTTLYRERIGRVRFFYPITLALLALGLLVTFRLGFFSALIETSRLGQADTSFALNETLFVEALDPNLSAVDIERRLTTLVGIESFQTHPIFGAGYMSTSHYVAQFSRFEFGAHGLPLGLLGETGLVGTVLFAICAWQALSGCTRSIAASEGDRRDVHYMERLSLIAALIAGLFHQANHDFYLYLFLGIGMANFGRYPPFKRSRLRAPAVSQQIAIR